jgi:2-phospho-L-lactate guanylyltransferase
VIVPADIPLVRAEDLRAVVLALGDTGAHAAIVRARDGGTNALAMRPPEAVPMRFGRESADAHAAEAARAGITMTELNIERMQFDVDSPDDLAALASLPVGPATAGWLAARAHYAAGSAG